MGHRLSKIYTRTGDEGTTGLGDGSRVSKDSQRVHALGDIDELNSMLGVLLASALPAQMATELLEIQHDLFDLGGEISIPSANLLPASACARLEALIDKVNADLPALKEFILPSGGSATAQCHVARAICRRAERVMVALAAVEPVNPSALQYINRLSDLLFVWARALARREGGREVMWDRTRFKA
jgi:cob(I)alamin adenosyltransferase